MVESATILIVDDEPYNVDYLVQELEDLGYATASAHDGRHALEQIVALSPDVILLDIMMPELDGFQVLAHLKANPHLRNIPVIVISAMTDMGSVVKGIKLGAEDYLPKPFNEVLLHARIETCLEKKRFRDQEVAYLCQVERLTVAAAALEQDAVETSPFDPGSLDDVASRPDGLGQLTRVFQRLAREFQRREQQLKQQVQELRIEVDKTRQAQQVSKITGTAYFQDLRGRAADLRARLQDEAAPNVPSGGNVLMSQEHR